MAAPTVDLRAHLDENYPRISKQLPSGVVSVLNLIWTGWKRLGWTRYILIAVLMWFVPVAMQADLVPYLSGGFGTSVLFLTGIWILLALGLSVVVGLAGLLDLGYVAFFMLGAYTTALMTESGAADQFHFAVWPTWAVLPVAMLVAMLAGAALGIPTLRLRGDYLAIVTLGFHEIVRLTMNNLEITNGSRGIFGIPHPRVDIAGFDYEFGLDAGPYWQYLLIPGIIFAVIMIRNLDNSRVGRYWTAIREDEVAAAAMGVPVVKMKVLAFVIGASTSGVAGWIYAVKFNFISPGNFPLLSSILVLSAVVVGGLGNSAGATIGAILVVTLPEVVREASGDAPIFGFDVETGRIAIFGLLLVLVMIFRPGGLLASKRRRTELHQAGAADAVIVEDLIKPEEEKVSTAGDTVESPAERGEG
ncbi:MAG: branched-chain amino acid ABC transporter permease [Actinomycetota bacterium]|nr:branched-chain amino acid ABC transporter permease [Actinomycetota bacterium]